MIPLNIVVAVDTKNGIGKDGELPWDLTGDLKHFREVTSTTRSPKKKNVVVMGRKTWDSIPGEYRPLPERTNVVLTKNIGVRFPEGVLKADSFDQVMKMANNDKLKNIIETIFVIGGQQVYEEAIKYPECEKLYITHVHNTFNCDTFFPSFNDAFKSVQASEEHKEDLITYHFEEYKRRNGESS